MKKKVLWLLFLLMPFIVFAEEGSVYDVGIIIFMEMFMSIHMSLFVLMPLSKIYSEADPKRLFWELFTIRALILLFFDFFTTYSVAVGIATLDFFAVFIGAFLVVPISAVAKKKSFIGGDAKVDVLSFATNGEGVTMKCKNCGKELALTDKFCQFCGSKVSNDTVNVTYNKDPKTVVNYSKFDSMYKLSEDEMVESFINKELRNASYGMNNTKIPSALLKRKNNLNYIFSLLLFVFVVMIFFHFPLLTYLVGIIILFIFKKSTKSLDVKKYIIKEVKSRPSEKVSNIVMNIKGSLVEDDKKSFRLIVNVVAIVVALILFINPHIIYEKEEDGYGMRYYAFGLTNFTSVEIPEEYNGEPVVSLRGNAFSNMFFLKKVKLPDTITEIRGQAFKNCYMLKEVNIPNELVTIGGASFYNCKSIVEVEFPDTVIEFGGEMFKNASSLKSVKLSDNITEIRGNSFENCTSLEVIDIPDKVTRIGGHAFYGDIKLKEVNIGNDSKLAEIGSSAFRRCDSLKTIKIPAGTIVNERAFKESPTKVLHFSGDGETTLNGYEMIGLTPNFSDTIYNDDYDPIYEFELLEIEETSMGNIYSIKISGNVNEIISISKNDGLLKISNDLQLKIVDEGYLLYIDVYYNG
ncbi:MAG: leucine-rich repeat protein [Bacilli bacterium]|nr:leucine-rich repeat protein [Bacilli bacterium]